MGRNKRASLRANNRQFLGVGATVLLPLIGAILALMAQFGTGGGPIVRTLRDKNAAIALLIAATPFILLCALRAVVLVAKRRRVLRRND